ncbi:hypothetical protein BdWA1_002012 [Babesia duncani]|uniref:Uncharacterized protein n=1 Tax=Babesia duncani TaxID=323732 RepID=A0AAD9UP57_9APIC|nr:hypothetical protein BdWA1_002012 [Babesia duncani]
MYLSHTHTVQKFIKCVYIDTFNLMNICAVGQRYCEGTKSSSRFIHFIETFITIIKTNVNENICLINRIVLI